MHVGNRHEEHVRIRQVQNLLGARRHARRVLLALHVDPAHGDPLHRRLLHVRHAPRDHLSLLRGERRVHVLGQNLLTGAHAEAIREGVGVPRRGRLEGQRPGVGVYSQREQRRVLLGYRHVFVLEHLRDNRGGGSDILDDELRGVDVRGGEEVMIQHHHLLRGVQPLVAVSDPVSALRVHHRGPGQRSRLDDPLLLDRELVLVQREIVRDARGGAPREDDERAVRAQARVAKLGEADRGGERVKVGADVRQDDAQRRAGVRGSHDGPRRVVGGRVVVLSLEVRLVLVVAAAHGLDTPRVDARDDARSPPGRRRPVHALDVVSTARRRLAEDAAVERPVDDRGAMMDRDGTKGRARDGARRRAGPCDIRREHPREDPPPRRGCVWRSSRGR